MQNSNKYTGPPEGSLDKRLVAAGVVGCFALAIICFMLTRGQGKPGTDPNAAAQQAASSIPAQSFSDNSERVGHPLSIKITESKKAAAKTDDKKAPTATDASNGVKKDANGLTVTLDPKSPDTAEQAESASSSTEPDAQTIQVVKKHITPSEGAQTEAGTAAVAKHRTSSRGTYLVQTGTFKSRSSAEEMISDLSEHGYNAEVKAVQVEDSTLYRVQMGDYRSKKEAEAIAGRLKSDGYQPTVLGGK